MKALLHLLAGALGCVVLLVARGQAAESPSPLDIWEIVARPVQAPQSLRGIAYQNGTFVAAGYGLQAVVSTNGTDWFTVSNGLVQFEGILAVVAGGGQFVAVGGPLGAIVSSPDGVNWTRRYSLTNVEFWAVTHAADRFVAVGFTNTGSASLAMAATSPDGIQWSAFNTGIQTTPRNVEYGKGMFVAAGALISMCSVDGQSWTPINSLLAQGIAFDGTQFFATLSTNGFSSVNGVDWTPVAMPNLTTGQTEQNYYTAAYANGVVIAGGHAGRYGLVAVSVGGGPFTPIPEAVREQMGAIRDAVFVDGRFYLADQSGKVWRSGRMAPASAPRLTAVSHLNDRTIISFSAPDGFSYLLESAERLDSPDWQTCVGPVFSLGENATVTDFSATGASRFYRLRIR